MNKKYFKGTGRLVLLLLRQHRLKILLWLAGIIGISLAVALAYPEIYPTQEDVMGFAATMDNPAMSALLGANYALEDYNIGAVFASEMLLFTAIAVAIMNILITRATTREDEEAGRVEIVQSLPVGKLSYLTASLSLMFLVNLALVLILGTSLATLGTDIFTWESSFLYSVILGATGLFFAGITAISAQLSSTTYGTNMFALALLLLAYLIRVIGDVQNETISHFSPLGWATRTEVFVNDDWLPIFVLGGSALVLILIAFYLHAKRDMFAGLLPNRSGKKQASSFLKTAPGFVWHLEKGKIIGWFLLLFLLSAAFGAILGELETYFADMDIIQVFLEESAGDNMTEQFITLLVAIMSIFSIIPGVSILHSLKGEEMTGRAEHFYTRSVSRNKILGSYFGWAMLAVTLMQIAIAIGLYATSNQVLDQSIDMMTFIEMALVYLPAMFLVLGLATLLLGSLPKFTLTTWLYIAFLFIVLYLGDLLELPAWLNNLSAFHHIPQHPHEAIDWNVMGILTGLGLFLTIGGFLAYNKRDINA